MSNFKKRMAVFFALIFLVNIILPFFPYNALGKSVTGVYIPKISIIKQPADSYWAGQEISVSVYSPKIRDKVQYRVVLTNLSTKKKIELWTNPKSGNYNISKIPAGYQEFVVKYPTQGVSAGKYTLSIYTRRYKANVSYDSYAVTHSFSINKASTTPFTPSGQLSTSDIVKAYDKSVVMTEDIDDNGEVIATGSGFSIGNGLFVTNHHVLDVDGVKKYRIVTNDSKEYEVDGIVKDSENLDIAIIKTTQCLNIPPVKIGSYKNSSKGDKIITIGSPEGLLNTVSEGIISRFENIPEYGVNLIQISAPITHGSSGGALFNNKGEVIGITSMGYSEGNLNFAVAADHLLPWMSEFKGKSFSSIAIVKRVINSSDPQISNTQTPAAGNNPQAPSSQTPTASTSTSSSNTVLGNSSYLMGLDMHVTDSVMDSTKPVIYITDSVNKKLYSINYITKQINQVSFALTPESIDYSNGRIYVALLKQEHNSYIYDGVQKGAFAIVDSNSLKVLDTVGIDVDPFDIVADNSGYVYITSGSGQWTYMKSYSSISRQEISQSSIRQQSYEIYNPVLNKIYMVDTDVSPRDIETRGISNGKFTAAYDSRYHGDYSLAENNAVSSDGTYIFNGSGNVFTASQMSHDDMLFAAKLNRGFAAITFDGTNSFFTSNYDCNIYSYNYSSLEQTGLYKTKGVPAFLYNRGNMIIAVTKTSNTGTNGYGLETIKLPGNVSGVSPDNVTSTAISYASYKIAPLMDLDFQITNIVKDPDKPVLYAVDRAAKKLYSVNYETKQVSQLSFPLPPESITYSNGKVYVTLLKQEHNPYVFDGSQSGAFAVVDAETMTTNKIVDIDIDPFSIAVDKDGYIYITSGSGQWTQMKSYSGDTFQAVDTKMVRQQSYVIYNSSNNKLYLTDTDSMPRDMEARVVASGKIISTYDSPYHGDYSLSVKTKLSSDNKYLFNSAGTVFISAESHAEDMKFAAQLNKGYTDIAFDGNNRFFTGQSNGRIYVYDYNSFNGTDSFEIGGVAEYMYYFNKKLIIITKTPKFPGSSLYNYSIQSVEI